MVTVVQIDDPNTGQPGNFTKVFQLTASSNTDTSAQFAHGFVNLEGAGIIPAVVHLDPLNVDAYTKEWCLGVVDDTNINLTASSGGGLAATPQLQITASLPMSIVR